MHRLLNIEKACLERVERGSSWVHRQRNVMAAPKKSPVAAALALFSVGRELIQLRRGVPLPTVRRLELADETTDDPAEAVSAADLLVIATPLSPYADNGRRIAPVLKQVATPMSPRSSRR